MNRTPGLEGRMTSKSELIALVLSANANYGTKLCAQELQQGNRQSQMLHFSWTWPTKSKCDLVRLSWLLEINCASRSFVGALRYFGSHALNGDVCVWTLRRIIKDSLIYCVNNTWSRQTLCSLKLVINSMMTFLSTPSWLLQLKSKETRDVEHKNWWVHQTLTYHQQHAVACGISENSSGYNLL